MNGGEGWIDKETDMDIDAWIVYTDRWMDRWIYTDR